jgi:poly(A) polymerase
MLTETIKRFVGQLFSQRSQGLKRISKDKHGIDRRFVSRHAIKVCEVLQHEGYQAYIVGGAVRDLIVGLEPKDFDVATSATPEQIRPLFRRARIIGRRFQLVHVVFGQEIIETSTFRAPASESQSTDGHGRILRDNEFGTHAQDAARRDFTINALYYDPVTEEVIDYHNGVDDLKHRMIRMVGDPRTRYREDPVRMLRAVRFAVKLKGKIEPSTKEPLLSMAKLIENVPASRLFDEMLKLLTCGQAMECLKQLRQDGLHKGILPVLDVVLEQPGGEEFIELALDRTDHRIRSGKTVSPSFLFAALLWHQVDVRWQKRIADGEPSIQALMEAADSVLDEQTEKLAIQKRISADMREIWFMQPRFEKRLPKSIWRMFEQPRFRAAVDFLQLRAAAHQFDSVLAQWWMDLADANDDTRAEMLEALSRLPRESTSTGPRSRTRRRRRSPSSASGGTSTSSGSSDNVG